MRSEFKKPIGTLFPTISDAKDSMDKKGEKGWLKMQQCLCKSP